MPSLRTLAFALLSLGLSLTQAAGDGGGKRGLRILAIMTMDTVSHHLWMAPLTARLAELGHHVHSVDVLMPKQRPATLNVTVIESALQVNPTGMQNLRDGNAFVKLHAMATYGYTDCVKDMSTPTMKRLLGPEFDGAFDLLIVDHGPSDCYLGLIHRFGYPPTVMVSPFPGGVYWLDSLMGNPALPAVLPLFATPFARPMSLSQRVYTTILHMYYNYIKDWEFEPALNVYLQEVFGPSIPPISELRKHVSLALVNEVPGLEPARPFHAAMIPVGGLHVVPAAIGNIPTELRRWLDEAPEGFIYMSFGSLIRGSTLDEEKRQAVIQAFASLKQRVIWKFEADEISKDLPANVRIGSWLPQNDILGHPNIRLFISHCGGLSLQESSYHGVPVLGVPLLVDQFLNVEKVVQLEMGRRLPYVDITKDRLLSAVLEIVQNPKYQENARRMSLILRDQKETPLERAVWWVEYVARHGGAPHLRSPALDQPWHQVMLLDVFAVLVLAVLAVSAVLLLTLRLVLRCLCSRRTRHYVEKSVKQD